MKYPISTSDFETLIKDEYSFIDKSLFIKDIMDDSAQVILITRPRRFGKTLNLSMLYYFLRQNHTNEQNLFAGLKISEDKEFCQQHQQQYPVIFISFKEIKVDTYTDAYKEIETLMQKLYREHRYLLEDNLLYQDEKNTFNALINKQADESDVKAAIEQLSAYMFRKFGKKPIILIDEYDTPIQEAYLKNYYDKMITLMRIILGAALKGNNILGKAVITGITRVAQESLFSGVNNLAVFTLLQEKYGQYFGFTEEETAQLLTQSKLELKFSSIKEWYNGYQIGKYVLYNPWSIINCLYYEGKLSAYWVKTASNALIVQLLGIAKFEVKQQIEELLQGNTIEQPIFEHLVFDDLKTSEGTLWSLLLFAGYLKVLSTEPRGNRLIAKMAIPNKEVSGVYDDIVEKWFDQIMSMNSYNMFVQSLINGNIPTFKTLLADYIIQSMSFFDFNRHTNEQIFHVFIMGLIIGLRDQYFIHSNQEAGLGRGDVIFIPKHKKLRGILLEFKTSESAELMLTKAQEALEQVKTKLYIETFKQHNVNSVLVIGLAFWGKQLELVHETFFL